MPQSGGDSSFAKKAVAGTSEGGAILPISINIVRDLIVDIHMIHLSNRKGNAMPTFAPVGGNTDELIITHNHAVRNQGIDPHVMIISTHHIRYSFKVLTPIQ